MEQRDKNRNTPKALKYRLYKQLRMEIWGSFILKKKKSKLARRLLRNFEYILTRKILINISEDNFALNRCFSSFFGLSFFKKNNKSALNFWMNFNKISYNLFNKFSYSKSAIFSLINFSRSGVRKQLNKIYAVRSAHAEKMKKKNKRAAKKYLHLLKLDSINFKKKRKFWVESRLWEKKASLFYGINNIKKFRKLKASFFCSSKLRISGGLRLELQLNIILFKIGIFGNNIFMINKYIRKGVVFINNRLVKNPLRSVKIGDNIHVNPKFRKRVYKDFIYKMKNRLIFLKLPSYIEYNFNILYFSLIRLPTRSEVLRFYYGAFYLTNPSILNFADNKRSLK